MTGLRKRVTVGFLSIVCLLFFSGMVSFLELSHLSRDTGEILKANKRNIELAKEMLDAAHEQNIALIRLSVFGDRSCDSLCRKSMERLENTLLVAQSEALVIVVWIAVGIKNLGWINKIAMAALFILSIVLCVVVFRGGTPVTAPDDSLSFGAAVELAVAMPLSWLPLISDYTREAEKPFAATLSSTLTYGVVSCWMYVIGMGAAIFTGEGDIALIMVKAGLGVAALLILILSTVTTTFLDAYSAGISAESLSKKINGKYAALIVTVIGTVCAICFPMDDITNFLYLIGSVFAPMIAIQITDFFLLRRGGASGRLDVCNAVVWVLGFVLYRVLMTVDIPVGNTLPDMAGTMLLCLIAHKLVPDKTKAA